MAGGSRRAFGAVAATFVLLLAACGQSSDDGPAAAPATALEGDASLIAAAQTVSDALGDCGPSKDPDHISRVVSLSDATIVLIACGDTDIAYTDRLFAVKPGQAPRLLALPDYGPSGWFASHQVGMAELDAGTGVLTTLRQDSATASCGSEARYQWNGQDFAIEELGWISCATGSASGPPYPLIWPPQIGSTVDPETATPAP